MPNITVELFSGRTLEQKRAFVAEVTDSTVRILKVKPESVRIRLVEMEPWDLGQRRRTRMRPARRRYPGERARSDGQRLIGPTSRRA